MIDVDIPAGLNDRIAQIKEALNEAIAETDEDLMEKFFAGEEFTHEEIHKGFRLGIAAGSLVPVFCGSAMQNTGIKFLMDAVVEYMPAPSDNPVIKGTKPGSDEKIEFKASPEEPFSALVFKTIADPFVGKVSIFRVYSGTLKSDSTVLIQLLKSLKKSHRFIWLGVKSKFLLKGLLQGI